MFLLQICLWAWNFKWEFHDHGISVETFNLADLKKKYFVNHEVLYKCRELTPFALKRYRD